MTELPIRQMYLDEARSRLPEPPAPTREPQPIRTSAHEFGHHELCGPDCEEAKTDG